MSTRVVEAFDLVEQQDRQHPGFAWNVAPDHEHDAELADRVREAEHGTGQQRAAMLWKHDAEEPLPGREAEHAGRHRSADAGLDFSQVMLSCIEHQS